nr:hypothetical protein [uncultured Psychroserpens sp.]
MKSLKKINILFFGLTLVFSLVSFSGISNAALPDAIKTELVVNDVTPDTRFSIQFNKADNSVFISIFSYFETSFDTFKIDQDLKANIAFKTYTNKTRSVIKEQFQIKLYALFNHKTIYEDSIV